MKLHLNRPGVVRTRNEFRNLGIRWVGHVYDGPPTIPEVPEIEIPSTVHLFDRDLECAAAATQIAVADRLHVIRLPTLRNLVGVAALREHRHDSNHHESDSPNNPCRFHLSSIRPNATFRSYLAVGAGSPGPV